MTPNQLASEQEFGQFECPLTDPQQNQDEEVKNTTQSSIIGIDNQGESLIEVDPLQIDRSAR